MKTFTIPEVAKMLNVSKHKIYYEIKANRVQVLIRDGRKCLAPGEINYLRGKFKTKERLTPLSEYLKSKRMSRGRFEYLRDTGGIEDTVIRIDGRIFIKVN